MDRRDFLKVSGLFSLILVAPANPLAKLPSLSMEAVVNGKVYRGTPDGEIYVSEDGGKTWHLHIRLGSQCSVAGLTVGAQQQVIALIEYLGYEFRLSLSPRSQAWRTM